MYKTPYIGQTKNSHPLTATKYTGLPFFFLTHYPNQPLYENIIWGQKKKKMELCFQASLNPYTIVCNVTKFHMEINKIELFKY